MTADENIQLFTGFEGESEEPTFVDFIDFSQTVQVLDSDFDPLTFAPGTLTFTVVDDVPILTGEQDLRVVEEEMLDSDNDGEGYPVLSDGNPDTDDDPADPIENPPGNYTVEGDLSALVSVGADELPEYIAGEPPFNVGFHFGDKPDSLPPQLANLASQGEPLSFTVDSSGPTQTMIAFVGDGEEPGVEDRVVFTLELNADGTYKFTLLDQLDHALRRPDAVLAEENSLTIDFSPLVQFTDWDGDTISLQGPAVDDGDPAPTFSITIVDDVPVFDGSRGYCGIDESGRAARFRCYNSFI